MNEKKKILYGLFVLFIIQSLIIYLLLPRYSENKSFYEKVVVNYNFLQNNIEVNELFDINIKNNWNVVYRSFDDSICFKTMCNIKIKDVNCELGIPYISLKGGKLFMKKGDNWEKINKENLKFGWKIYENEVGCYYEQSYLNKKEVLKIDYVFDKNYVEKQNYIHAFFTREHLPIKELETKNDKKENVPKNVPILINIKTGKIKIEEYKFLPFVIIFILDSVIFLIWWFFGRDKEFLVPEYLHRKPINPETNKEEDYFTYGVMYNVGRINKNIITALFFSLKLRGLLKKVEKRGFLIKEFLFYFDKEKLNSINQQSNQKNFNKFEIKFIEFIKENAKEIEEKDDVIIYIIKPTSNYEKRKFYNFFNKTLISPIKERLSNTAFIIMVVFIILIFSIAFILPIKNTYLKNILSITLSEFFITSILFTLLIYKELVKFKREYYKEYLEIESFRRFLNDYAQLKKYFPEDKVIWKDWLLIATALGVADNVIKVMREKGFKIDELLDYEEIKDFSVSFYSGVALSSSSSSSGGFEGAGGGGGGGR